MRIFNEEFLFLEMYASSEDLSKTLERIRFRCLWTAYCLHSNCEDGRDKDFCDAALRRLHKAILKNENCKDSFLTDWKTFSQYMSDYAYSNN